MGRPSVNFYLWQPKLKPDIFICFASDTVQDLRRAVHLIFELIIIINDGSSRLVDLAYYKLFQYHNSIVK